MQEFKFLRTPPMNFSILDTPVEIETLYVRTTEESEGELTTAIHEVYSNFYQEVGVRPKKLVLGAEHYEQLVGYCSRMGGGPQLPEKFMGMEIVIVDASIIEVVGSTAQQFGRLYRRKRKL